MENQAVSHQSEWLSSPPEKLHQQQSSRSPLQEIRYVPDSPPEKSHVHSDDLIGTSEIKPTTNNNNSRNNTEAGVDFVYVSRPVKQPILLVGGCEDITIGRGGNATIKIGKRNRQISRIHARIEYEAETHQHFFNVLGLNGAMVDNVLYRQHDRILLKDDAMIDILGSKITFMCPDDSVLPPMHRRNQQQPVTPPSPQMEPEVVVDDEDVVVESPLPVRAAAAEEEEDEKQRSHSVLEREEPVASLKQFKEEPAPALVEQQFEEPVVQLPTIEEPQVQIDEPTKEPKQEEDDDFVLDSQEIPLSPDPKDQMESKEEEQQQKPLALDVDYAEVIIDALVFSRKSSMPISDICSRIMSTNPTYKTQSREIWIERIQQTLKEKPFFGEIVRKGKTADGSPKENLYYYNSQEDPVEWRRAEYTHVGRSARKCTLQDKQYFWKIPPKLGRNRNAYVPPPAKAYEKRKGNEENMDGSNKKFKSDE